MLEALALHDSATRQPVHEHVFDCSWTTDGLNVAWVHVTGDLHVLTAPQLRRTLQQVAQSLLQVTIVDLRRLASIDGAGIGALVDASIEAQHAGGRLIVLRARPAVDRLFRHTDACDRLQIGDLPHREPRSPARQEVISR